MSHVETEIRLRGLARVELGVFEFNENARRMYEGLGYREIARIKDFTYWNGRMWQDIRMEKRLYRKAGTARRVAPRSRPCRCSRPGGSIACPVRSCLHSSPCW